MRTLQEQQLGLQAWERQRRNRWRQRAQRIMLAILLAWAATVWLPDDVNPLVQAGVVEASGVVRHETASYIAAAVERRETARREARQPLPPPLAVLPPEPADPATLAPDTICLARLLFADVRWETIEAQIAVAQVAINRHRASGKPSLCQSIHVGADRTMPPASHRLWLQALWIADDVAAGHASFRELAHAKRHHTVAENPDWRLAYKPVRRIGHRIFYVSIGAPIDQTYAHTRRRWDEAGQFEMIGEDSGQAVGKLLPASASSPSPAPGAPVIARKPPATANTPAFNPFANTSDQR